MHRRALLPALLLPFPALAQAPPLSIVAAENVYGDVAAQIAGPRAAVTSILTNPEQDPHLFEASPSVARALAGADLVVMNGLDYDPWMTKLLGASRATARRVLVAGTLLKRRAGANPHVWYDPAAMPVVARAIAASMGGIDPAHAAEYAQRLAAFEASMRPLTERVAALKARLAGPPVTATEPVFGYMATALGLVMRNERFQLSIMNGTEPRASDVAAFDADLRQRRVRLFLYNAQATGPAAQRLLALARQSGIPIVGVTETAPPNTSYVAWMLAQLQAVDAALPA